MCVWTGGQCLGGRELSLKVVSNLEGKTGGSLEAILFSVPVWMVRATQSDVVLCDHGGASDETAGVPAPLLAAKKGIHWKWPKGEWKNHVHWSFSSFLPFIANQLLDGEPIKITTLISFLAVTQFSLSVLCSARTGDVFLLAYI